MSNSIIEKINQNCKLVIPEVYIGQIKTGLDGKLFSYQDWIFRINTEPITFDAQFNLVLWLLKADEDYIPLSLTSQTISLLQIREQIKKPLYKNYQILCIVVI